ncbi:hypothetical protein [Salmon gill poxvirus]|nr:hypothetical protein [Salmon gill poxvirus]
MTYVYKNSIFYCSGNNFSFCHLGIVSKIQSTLTQSVKVDCSITLISMTHLSSSELVKLDSSTDESLTTHDDRSDFFIAHDIRHESHISPDVSHVVRLHFDSCEEISLDVDTVHMFKTVSSTVEFLSMLFFIVSINKLHQFSSDDSIVPFCILHVSKTRSSQSELSILESSMSEPFISEPEIVDLTTLLFFNLQCSMMTFLKSESATSDSLTEHISISQLKSSDVIHVLSFIITSVNSEYSTTLSSTTQLVDGFFSEEILEVWKI